MNSFCEKMERIEALEATDGIGQILNAAYEIIGNPIVLFDTSYNLLSYTDGITTDDRLWNELVSLGTFSHESIDFFNTENFIVSFATSETVILMQTPKLKYDRVTGKLFDKDNVQLAAICMPACIKPLEPYDPELVERLCEILSEKLSESEYYGRIDRVYSETIWNKLLAGELADGNNDEGHKLKAAVAELYEGLKKNLYLAVADTALYEQTSTHLAYFRDYFKKLQPEYTYFIHHNYVVILISTDRNGFSPEREMAELNGFFTKYKIYAGVSGQFQCLDELNARCREALAALNYGLKSTVNRNIFNYDNYRTEHLLSRIKNLPESYEFDHAIASAMLEYDLKNNTSYVKTFYTYSLYGLNLRLAAAHMGLTTKQLSARLKKMRDLFGISWINGDMLYSIFITLKVSEKYNL